MSEFKQCKAKNCVYPTRDIIEDDLVRTEAGTCYHRKCKELRDKMGGCIGLYQKLISKEQPATLLGKAFKEMIYEKEIDPNLIIFTIKYCVLTHRKVNSVFSLYYIFNRKDVLEAYEQYKLQPVKFDFSSIEVAKETKINYRPNKRKGWNKIIDN